jgi:hypothetical protein
MNEKKKKFLMKSAVGFLALILLTVVFTKVGQAIRGDLMDLQFDIAALRGQDAFRVDSTGNLRLYQGDVKLGDAGTTPGYTAPTSQTAGNYFGLKVPFYNAGTATTQGTVILASTTATNFGYGSSAAVLATTTVLGVADGVYANGAVGYMTISGYALVLTTGAVKIGDILISTDGTNAAGAVGYAGAKSSPAAATEIGVAFSSGTTAGGLTLVKLK